MLKKIVISTFLLCLVGGLAWGFVCYKDGKLYEKAREIPVSAWDEKYQK